MPVTAAVWDDGVAGPVATSVTCASRSRSAAWTVTWNECPAWTGVAVPAASASSAVGGSLGSTGQATVALVARPAWFRASTV